MTESRSGLSSSASARATASMTVAGRNAPASSWASVVRRASNSGAGRGVAGLEGGLGMILANVRGRLRAQDFLLVALALAHGDTARRARYERQLLEEGPDELLDEPGLLAALLALRTLMVPSPALFTYVAVRHTLRAAGLDDAGERAFLLRAHLGNYSLWLAGLFPDYIAARRSRKGGPDLPYYDELGRQGFRLAAQHRLAEHLGVATIYRSAAERFPTLRVAFNRLSDRVFFPNVSTPDKILRNL